MKILVTGASGFVGGFLLTTLRDAGHEVKASSRSRVEQGGIECVVAPELGPSADWGAALDGIDAVVHLAGLAHVGSEKKDTQTERVYQRINAEGTQALARQSVAAGVKHFVFLSSSHAVAAESLERLTEKTRPNPVSAYGRSKLDAEILIDKELSGSGCAWTILRPPLVYGPGDKANFAMLLKLVQSGIPLPLASVRNKRNFIYIENLVDIIAICIGNPKTFGKIYFPSDGEDVSTPELIRKIALANSSSRHAGLCEHAAGCSTLDSRLFPLIFPFPEKILKALERLSGLGALRKLLSSLYVDSAPIHQDLGWKPRFRMEEGLLRRLGGSERGGVNSKAKESSICPSIN